MSVANKFEYITIDDYLRDEEVTSVKREYVDGRVFAMGGANRRHNIIAGNIFTALHANLDGTPCRPYMEAFKARIREANCFYYPDVMVACDKLDEESIYTECPVLIAEVLSASTAAVDRREKLINYMKIPTLCEYLIVHQRRKKVEVYRKTEDGNWICSEFSNGDEIELASLPKGKFVISLDTIYKNVLSGDDTARVREGADKYYLSREEAELLDW